MSTYTPIASQTLGSAVASVTFSSIPQGYTDLVLVVNSGSTASGQDIRCRFNSDTGSNYSFTFVTGNGSAASSNRATSQTFMPLDYNGYLSGSIATTTIINCMNYSNSTTYKTILGRFNTAAFGTDAAVGLWRSTSAITSIEFLTSASTFLAGSTFSIYGIQVGDKAQKAQGGNIVTSDGTYVYHTFTSSGAFIPSQALSVDYLVVAGGGSGGSGGVGGGGGGAGGMRCTVDGTGGAGGVETPLSLSSGKSYPVIIGAGGAGVTSAAGNNGSNSVFATITSTGGGGGSNGGATGIAGNDGGSGGGGAGRTSASGGAANPSGQGYAGGAAVGTAGSDGGGGGGGASQAGQQGQNPVGGYGGAGRATSISGSSVTYAGGGGGGSGSGSTGGAAGSGGGGTGGASAPGTPEGTAGTANTGGGSGGTRNGGVTSTNGGSGIVIIRYAL